MNRIIIGLVNGLSLVLYQTITQTNADSINLKEAGTKYILLQDKTFQNAFLKWISYCSHFHVLKS